jgi:DNA polymerase-3 subunit beta
MKFEAPKSVIFEALQSASYAVPNKSTLQILNNFLLRLEGNFLEISATDLDLGIRVRTEVTGHRDGSVVVNARKLLDLVKVLPDTPVSLSVDDYLLRISWGQKGKASITGFDASDFPAFPELGEGQAFSLNRTELAFLADKTNFAVSTDSTRLTLNGVYLESRENLLYCVATDGHRMGRAFIEQEAQALQKGIIVPPKAISHVLRAVGDDSAIEIRVDDSHILFSGENIQVVSKLIEGPYPKYESVIPLQFERTIQANRTEFGQVIKHVSAIANQRTNQIRLALEDGNLEISASDANAGGECRESFAVTHQGNGPFVIGFNGKYLGEILAMCPSEEILMKLNSAVGACVIEPVGEGLDFFFLLMPLRLVDDN